MAATPRVLILARHTGLHQLAAAGLRGQAEVARAFSATLALTMLQEHTYDLILAEAHLPRPFAGDRFLKAVRALPEYAAVPILGLGWELERLPPQPEKHLRKLGFDGSLLDPRTPADFADTLLPYLSPRRPNAAA